MDAGSGRYVLVGTAIVARLVLLLVPLLLALSDSLPARTSGVVFPDATRYQQLVGMHGQPYRDFPVEYPPLLLGAVKLLHGSSVVSTMFRVGFLSLILDLLVALLLYVGWGSKVAGAYLLLGLPLAYFLYFRLDLLSVFLAVLGITLVRRGRERSGGVAVAAAVLTKLWPVVAILALAVRRRWRAVRWTVAALAAGCVGWLLLGGAGGPAQVLTLRGATGWQVESLVGSLLWALGGLHPRYELLAARVGMISTVEELVSVAVAVLLMGFIWRWASRRPDASEGLAFLASLTALMLTAPILSPQYLSWLLPWAAIAAASSSNRWIVALVAAATTFTGIMWWTPAGMDWLFKSLLLFRNACLLGVLALAILALRTGKENRVPGAQGEPRPLGV